METTAERVSPDLKVKAVKAKTVKKKKITKKVKKTGKNRKIQRGSAEKTKAELKKAAMDLAIKVKATETRGIVNTMLNLFSRKKSGLLKESEIDMSFLKNIASAEETFKFFTGEYKKAKKAIEKITEL